MERIHETWLHTLGNLTLTGYNSEHSDRAFIDKRDMQGGFKQSPLRLTDGLGAVEAWHEDSIKNRFAKLAQEAVRVWAAPVLPDEILDTYRNVAVKPEAYNLEDHPQLADESPMRALFEQLRKEVLALDPSLVKRFSSFTLHLKLRRTLLMGSHKRLGCVCH